MTGAIDRLAGYLAIAATAAVARGLLVVLPVSWVTAGQKTMWSWPVFVLFAAAFATAVALAERAELPRPGVTLRTPSAVVLALLAGSAVGGLTILTDVVAPAAAARGVESMHVQGVAAVPFYIYGAILLTVLFHFLPIAAAAWLARRIGGGAGRAIVAAAVLAVTFSEDFSYFFRQPLELTTETARHVLSVAANGVEAWLIYRYGLLAGLLQRGTTYALWHVAWPALGG